MQLEQARLIAQAFIDEMAPFCERIEVAGSIRREKPDVKDIEIVAVPLYGEVETGASLFGNTVEQMNLLYTCWAMPAEVNGELQWIKTGTSEMVPWQPNPDGKYWRGLIDAPGEQIKLDLFLCTPANWGAIFLIRTGSQEFSQAVAAHAQRIERNFAKGFLTMSGLPVDTFEEEKVFELLGLHYVEPAARLDGRAVRAV